MDFSGIDRFVEATLRAARIPGAALAVVAHGETVFCRAYGYRDLEAQLPVTPGTAYPIASTTKAINATLLGMLVDEGRLAWDTPVQCYLPRFGLGGSVVASQVTLRDLVTMRTGLPRHDWMWVDNPLTRAQLVERLGFLALSAGFRERFQYNNLTATTAGHIAEVVTGCAWEELVRTRILEPLGMSDTTFGWPDNGEPTLSYHEGSRRELLVTRRFATEVTAPSGGSIYSTVRDMARWISFNIQGAQRLAEIHTPRMVVGSDGSGPTPDASYALGWFVDYYNGHERVSHGGYLHDVNSDVMIFPQAGVGIVSFTNFGPPRMAGFINQCVFDLCMGLAPAQTLEAKLAEYERKIEQTCERNSSVRKVAGTAPSHPLCDYAGGYAHPAYGNVTISCCAGGLAFRRNELTLELQHWHFDFWVARNADLFPIHTPHAFDPVSLFSFETTSGGAIGSVSIRLEPAVDPIRFLRVQHDA